MRSFVIIVLAISTQILWGQSSEFKTVFDNYYDFYQKKDFYQASIWSEKLTLEAEKEFGKGSMLHYNTILYAAEAFFEARNYSKSAYFYKLALDHVSQSGKITDDALQYMNKLSILYAYTGEYALSKLFAEKTLTSYAKSHGENTVDYTVALSNTADVYAQMDLFDVAIEMHEAAYQKILKIDPSSWQSIMILNNLGTAYLRNKKHSLAEKSFTELVKKAESIYGKDHFVTLTFTEQLAVTYQNMERIDEAIVLHLKCKEGFEKLNQQETDSYFTLINNLAHCYYEKGNYAEALAMSQKSYDYFKRINGDSHPETFLTKFNVGYCMLKTKESKKGFEILSQAMRFKIDHLEQNFYAFSETERIETKISVERLIQQFYQTAVEYGALSDSPKANPMVSETVYNFHLANKAQILKSIVKTKNMIKESGNKQLIQSYQDWESQKNMIAHYGRMTDQELKRLNINLEKLKQDAEKAEKLLSVQAKELKLEFTTPNYTVADIQKQLKEKEAAIEIIRLKNEKDQVKYLVLVLYKNKIKSALISNGLEMEKKFYTYYKNSLEVAQKDEISFNIFWKPIAEILENNTQKVFLSSEGVYNVINLSGLLNPVTQKYLDEELEIVHLTTTKDIIPQNPLNLSKEVVLFGNPDFELKRGQSNQQRKQEDVDLFEQKRAAGNAKMLFDKLPGTEMEVKNIEKILKQTFSTKIFLAEKAIEENVKKVDRPRVLHLATHGYFEKSNSQNPVIAMLNSGIVLSGVSQFYNLEEKPKTEDGFLSAYEAQNLNLEGTELVVLSACQTGLGMQIEGEGVFGLQRAFQVAGCKNVVMSLWNVNDQTTQELMSEFYKHFMEGHDVRQSFAKAKSTLRERYPHPKYWSAFVLVGKL